jgi:arylsulfatase A-like enzyme
MTWDLDESLGQLFDALEKLDIEDRTYVVFMSDNGAPGNRRRPDNSPLFAGKGTLYEGGIRVPLIIAGPGLETGYCAAPVSGTDLFATFASWSGAAVGSNESEDLTPLLRGKPEQFTRDRTLFFHYPHYGRGQFQTPQSALVSGEWKLLKDWETDTYKLFNLVSDPGEQNDISSREADTFRQLMTVLDKRLEETGAQLPSGNPDYDPSTTPQRRNRRN